MGGMATTEVINQILKEKKDASGYCSDLFVLNL